MEDRYFIATPIFYPNGTPHIGHAYNVIAADVIARFQRASGKTVFFLSGTDEHGLKMQQTAQVQNMHPQELADKNSAVFKHMLDFLNCSVDCFIRTTEEHHKKACQKLWKLMEQNGDIYLGSYEGWYSVRQEAYYEDNETKIREDGRRYEKQLGSLVEWNKEQSYFFRLSKYQDKLLQYYADHPDFIAPEERRNEVISFVKSGLKDISISRTTFDWGVPVPGDNSHVMYVWVDALTNYIAALDFAKDTSDLWNFWPANLHLIGKDIIRFHAVYWPAFLMSAGLALPKRIFAHGFLLNRGEKMSKSVGNVVDPFRMVATYGLDPVRYFFLREVPFGKDGSYNHQAIVNRINADLANDLGNLAQRSLSIIAKNCEGRVPAHDVLSEQDEALLRHSSEVFHMVCAHMEKQALHAALSDIFEVIAQTNRYFTAEQPWTLRKNDPKRFGTVLYVTLEVLRRVALMLQPFIPRSAERLLDLLGIPPHERMFKALSEKAMVSGATLPAPEAIFPRYVASQEEEL